MEASRDASRAEETIKALDAAARGSDNLMPKILDCARALCTVGEIANVLRDVFGEYREIKA